MHPFSGPEKLDSKYRKADYKALVRLNADLKRALLECNRTEASY